MASTTEVQRANCKPESSESKARTQASECDIVRVHMAK